MHQQYGPQVQLVPYPAAVIPAFNHGHQLMQQQQQYATIPSAAFIYPGAYAQYPTAASTGTVKKSQAGEGPAATTEEEDGQVQEATAAITSRSGVPVPDDEAEVAGSRTASSVDLQKEPR